jgi:hypothetical protein
MHHCRPLLAALLAGVVLLLHGILRAEPVAVRHTEGVVHGFLVLRSLEGTHLADGELTQFARGDQVTTRLAFQFKDGSTHEETVVYSQRGTFRLLSNHLVQKGPAFPVPREVRIDGTTGRVTARYTEDGKQRLVDERLDLPADVANGLTLTLIKNLPRGAQPVTVSIVRAAPNAGLAKAEIVFVGEEPFSIGSVRRTALRYVVKAKLGDLAKIVAPLLGKKPPADTHVWIVGGEAPGFVKSEGPLYSGGPTWRIELTSPAWR